MTSFEKLPKEVRQTIIVDAIWPILGAMRTRMPIEKYQGTLSEGSYLMNTKHWWTIAWLYAFQPDPKSYEEQYEWWFDRDPEPQEKYDGKYLIFPEPYARRSESIPRVIPYPEGSPTYATAIYEWWFLIHEAILSGRLQTSAKVSLSGDVLCVYYEAHTKDAIRGALRTLGITWSLPFRLDSQTTREMERTRRLDPPPTRHRKLKLDARFTEAG
jgi:hypothetical protein